MAKMGIDVAVLVPAKHLMSFRTQYALDIVRGIGLCAYHGVDTIADAIAGADVVIATVFTSVNLVKEALELVPRGERPRPAYYIQDYEPLFCEPHSEMWNQAMASYEAIDDMILFAKTRWLCEQVERHHRRRVELVEPSIDHDTYYPDFQRPDRPRMFTAMLRPSTPRRAPARTARILSWLASEHDDVEAHAFGCSRHELEEAGIVLDPRVKCHGSLRREEVAALLRASHFFLDLSDYQAFGRTAVEAMASGCVPVVPALGGARETIEDGISGIVVDTFDEASIEKASELALRVDSEVLAHWCMSAVNCAAVMSLRRAALRTVATFTARLPRKRV